MTTVRGRVTPPHTPLSPAQKVPMRACRAMSHKSWPRMRPLQRCNTPRLKVHAARTTPVIFAMPPHRAQFTTVTRCSTESSPPRLAVRNRVCKQIWHAPPSHPFFDFLSISAPSNWARSCNPMQPIRCISLEITVSIPRKLSGALVGALLYACAIAQTAANSPKTASAPAASVGTAARPVEYRSAFENLPTGVERATEDWRASNDRVGRFKRGHPDILKAEEAAAVQHPRAAASGQASPNPAALTPAPQGAGFPARPKGQHQHGAGKP
jgi:hypothetical protein